MVPKVDLMATTFLTNQMVIHPDFEEQKFSEAFPPLIREQNASENRLEIFESHCDLSHQPSDKISIYGPDVPKQFSENTQTAQMHQTTHGMHIHMISEDVFPFLSLISC